MTMMMPTGFRFNPTDEELIEFLLRKVSGQEMHIHGHFILDKDVYELDPQHLQWDYDATQSSNERFYFCLRENDSREVSGRGWWRATGHVKKVYANYYNKQCLVGFKRPLTFHRFSDNNQTKRNKAIKTNWIMHEYGLESISTDWRLCRIKYKGKSCVQEELENIRRATAEQQEVQQLPYNPSLQQHNNNTNEPYYYYPEASLFDFSWGETQQQQSLQLNINNNINVYESYSTNNVAENILQMEAMVTVENQQQQLSINASYDPYYYCVNDDYKLQLPASNHQQFMRP